MSSDQGATLEQQLHSPSLPLAVYREVAAHLSQVEQVEVDLLPQQSTQFAYDQSQVGGLRLRYPSDLDPASRSRIEQILAYYGDRFGQWTAYP